MIRRRFSFSTIFRTSIGWFALAGLALLMPAFAQTPKTVTYHATMNDVKYTYGPATPVARLQSSDVLETNTVDAFGNALEKPGDTLSMVKGDNPLTGPFFIQGAEPGDRLAAKFPDIQVDGNQAVSAVGP